MYKPQSNMDWGYSLRILGIKKLIQSLEVTYGIISKIFVTK